MIDHDPIGTGHPSATLGTGRLGAAFADAGVRSEPRSHEGLEQGKISKGLKNMDV